MQKGERRDRSKNTVIKRLEIKDVAKLKDEV